MTTFTTIKSVTSVVPYSIDWSDTLNTPSPVDTISTSAWTADNGLVVDSDSKTTIVASVVVSAGTLHKYASLKNTIVTAAGHTHVRTISVAIQAR